MKTHLVPYSCFTFIIFVVLALPMHVIGAEYVDRPAVTANGGFPTQVFRLHIGKCHFDPKEAGWFSGGRPEVQIAYFQGGNGG